MKKKVLALLFGGALAVSLCACGGQPVASDSTDPQRTRHKPQNRSRVRTRRPLAITRLT